MVFRLFVGRESRCAGDGACQRRLHDSKRAGFGYRATARAMVVGVPEPTGDTPMVRESRKGTSSISTVPRFQHPEEKELPRPAVLRVRAGNIPEILRKLTRWVLWDLEQRHGKWTKVPYQLDGRRASSTDPQQWATFDRVLKAYRGGRWDGIGFVFAADDDIVGVDLDHCRDARTGVVEPWAQEIIDTLNSYTELSPSGCGIHIFVKAEFRSTVNRKGMVEIYCKGRYFTVTGHAL